MKEYVIDANEMAEKELNRTIKEQATYHDKLIIENPEIILITNCVFFIDTFLVFSVALLFSIVYNLILFHILELKMTLLFQYH